MIFYYFSPNPSQKQGPKRGGVGFCYIQSHSSTGVYWPCHVTGSSLLCDYLLFLIIPSSIFRNVNIIVTAFQKRNLLPR